MLRSRHDFCLPREHTVTGIVGLFVGPVVLAVTWRLFEAWAGEGALSADACGPRAGVAGPQAGVSGPRVVSAALENQ